MKWFAEYVGIPFKSLGRDLNGCDCYGLVRIVMLEQYNIDLPELLTYDNALDHANITDVITNNIPLLSGKKVDSPEEGAVVIFATQGLSSHIGLFVSDKLILHTTKNTGSVIESVNTPRIKNKIRGIYNVNKNYSTNKSI